MMLKHFFNKSNILFKIFIYIYIYITYVDFWVCLPMTFHHGHQQNQLKQLKKNIKKQQNWSIKMQNKRV